MKPADPSSFRVYSETLQALARKTPGLDLDVLYRVDASDDWPIYTLQFGHPAATPRALIASGFHGDEPAGPLAILSFLSLLGAEPALAAGWALTILPVVNPTGFALAQRLDHRGLDLNRGYLARAPGEPPCPEVETLKAYLAGEIFHFALMLHEDSSEKFFYLYSGEPSSAEIAARLVRVAERYFETARSVSRDGARVNDEGMIDGHGDGSLEDWLSHNGSSPTFCVEVPGTAPLRTRVEASLQFILFLLEHLRRPA